MPILHWLNDEEARKTSSRVPYRLLEADGALSVGDPNTENMLIQGDNLEALKALLPYYAGQVKCIYIDPPYNTQSAFEHYDDNLEHSIWLSTMYPRLEMLRDLLSNDGSIWVSIDDNEGHYLKVLMDEVFGRNNFLTTICWEKIYTLKNSAKHFSEMHDFIFVYAKNIDTVKLSLLPRSEKQNVGFKNPDDDPRGPWLDSAMHGRNFYSKGSYEVASPSGKIFTPPPGRYWTVSHENFTKIDRDNRIWWGKNKSNAPRKKTFLTEVRQGVVPGTIWFYRDSGQNAEAKGEIKNLFSQADEVFITPKPEKLIQRVLAIGSNENDLVLDSFLGSGTTAAVAHKMGRRYIGIEMGEHAVTHCLPRLQKVIEGEQGGISEEVNWQGGGGFHFYHLGETIFNEAGQINPAVKFRSLAAHVWFTETHTPRIQSVIAGESHRGIASAEEHRLAKTSPLLGIHNGTAYYLLYNGILGDKSKDGGNVLTGKVLAMLPPYDGPKVIYGELTTFGSQRLTRENIVFKQVPYDVKAR